MKIKVSFRSEFMLPIREGRKRMTSRSEPLGDIGDTFDAFGMTFEITEIFQSTLENVSKNFFQLEGVASPEEFQKVWAKIHPLRGFVPDRLVWVHRFAVVKTP